MGSSFVITLLLLGLWLLPDTTGLQVYYFQAGNNATFSFHHELHSTNSSYDLDIFSPDMELPFYDDGSVDPNNLKPNQRGRFDVDVHQTEVNVTISVTISEIEIADNGVYLGLVTENSMGLVTENIYNAYIAVTGSPNEAECEIHPSTGGQDLLEVRCYASLDSDVDGQLACFQNSSRVSPTQPIAFIGNQISAEFLIKPNSPSSWCGVDPDINIDDVDPSSCVDYVYAFPTPALMTSKTSPSIHDNHTQESSHKEGDTYSRSVNSGEIGVMVLVGVLVSIILMMAIKDTVIDFVRGEKWKKREDRKKYRKHGGNPDDSRRGLTVAMVSSDEDAGQENEQDEVKMMMMMEQDQREESHDA